VLALAGLGRAVSLTDMRVRITELLKERDWSAYDLTKAIGALPQKRRVSDRTVYRLVRAKGTVKRIDTVLLAALCEVFGVGPGELFEMDRPTKRKAAK
jgi:DNA-binding Xre family transcriptional regulator